MNRAPRKAIAPGQGGDVSKADQSNRSRANYSSRSTATEAQRRRIVEMLRAGPKSTLDFRRAGVMQSQTRIFELRNKLGFDIPTVARITTVDPDGYQHCGVALYQLVAEPQAGGCDE
ncbi:helix-turn-helix domain-containing protein [Niveibacterium sp.]|uniref:helix-turn-helix domain-containing protein n=1 Tax=Niveibacterium sp. TaxID=2017444 RepID=UPI0035B4124D